MKIRITFDTDQENKKLAKRLKYASGYQLRKIYEIAFTEGLLVLEKTYKDKL